MHATAAMPNAPNAEEDRTIRPKEYTRRPDVYELGSYAGSYRAGRVTSTASQQVHESPPRLNPTA
jgi:hypothetical protein